MTLPWMKEEKRGERRQRWGPSSERAGRKGTHGTSVDLLDEGVEFTSDVGGVAVEDGRVAGTDLTGVVEDDDLGVERGGLLGEEC